MQTAFGNTIKEVLTSLSVAESSYFRWKARGWAYDEIVLVDGKAQTKVTIHKGKVRVVDSESSNIESFFGHKKHLKGWTQWRDDGFGMRIWSKTYRQQQTVIGKRYFEKFDVISTENLKTWMQEMPADSSHSGRVDRYSFVASMAKYLYSEVPGTLTEDDYIRIKGSYPRKSPNHDPVQHIIHKEDLDSIFAFLPEHYEGKEYHAELLKCIIIFMSETGVRISEMASIQRTNLTFSDDHRKATVRVKGKGGKWRTIPFSKVAQEAIREYLKVKPKKAGDNSLFKSYHYHTKVYQPVGKTFITHELRDISTKLRLPFSAHSFRHYRITQWANNPKIPITATQIWAGHNSLLVTQKYIHIRDEDALEAAVG